MKFAQIILVLLIISVNFVYTQEKSLLNIRANITILDTAGNPVEDIKVEDIKIFEDGIEQKITQFTKREIASNIGFVIDNTGSMRLQFDTILDTTTKIVNQLNTTDESFIVRFVSTDKTTIWEDWTSDKNKLRRSIDSMYIEGGQSAILDGLNLAMMKIRQREEKEPNKKYSLILISDCEDRESASVLNGFLNNLQNSNMQIYVIALTGELTNGKNSVTKKYVASKDNAENLANNLALTTGGNVFFIEKPKEETINEVVKKLTTEIHAPFVVSYTSTNQKRDGKQRKLTIQVADGAKGEKRQGFIREGFVVTKN